MLHCVCSIAAMSAMPPKCGRKDSPLHTLNWTGVFVFNSLQLCSQVLRILVTLYNKFVFYVINQIHLLISVHVSKWQYSWSCYLTVTIINVNSYNFMFNKCCRNVVHGFYSLCKLIKKGSFRIYIQIWKSVCYMLTYREDLCVLANSRSAPCYRSVASFLWWTCLARDFADNEGWSLQKSCF